MEHRGVDNTLVGRGERKGGKTPTNFPVCSARGGGGGKKTKKKKKKNVQE